jgi:hypothetical protein
VTQSAARVNGATSLKRQCAASPERAAMYPERPRADAEPIGRYVLAGADLGGGSGSV